MNVSKDQYAFTFRIKQLQKSRTHLDPEEEGTTIFWNNINCLPTDTV